MTPADHDPDDTGLPVDAVLAKPEHPLSEPLEKLSTACEALQTWASDLASRRSKKPMMSPREARLDKTRGEALLAEVLQAAAPVLGELASVGGKP